ncbi:MAG: hypothetical protein EAZ89_01920 [Bacteroidetes bacterium]|jgi:hypothetical protein|nr:MAG: hypothetical protein EAZ89_01920 [Bacteroidota bacterium]
MKKDIPIKPVEDVIVAVLPREDAIEGDNWEVYVINLKETPITNVLISSRGYGTLNGKEIKTSVLRHFFEEVAGESYHMVEHIQPEVFPLNNEYWISFTYEDFLFDKRYTFVSESIAEKHLTRIPLMDRKGVMIR